MIKEEHHIFQGMLRDLAMSRLKPEFLWEAHNIRITSREDNSLFSITNEKGNIILEDIVFKNNYVGHCIAGDYLIVFTATEDDGFSTIYRIDKEFNIRILYDDASNTGTSFLGLSPLHPLETLYSYETELILKVYWIDGINLPRVINIVKDKLLDIADTNDFTQSLQYNSNSFNFVPYLNLQESIEINRINGTGMFPSGTIQYAFTYYNKYTQESNIFYTTPLQYISPIGRGGSPEETNAVSFKVTIKNIDRQFGYIRVYSILRTSLDGTPATKRVIDIPINEIKNEYTFIDSGTIGDNIDPTLLLYVGGREIIADTLQDKDGTLFLGGIEIKERQELLKNIILSSEYSFTPITFYSEILNIPTQSTYYNYPENILSYGDLARFKYNETYRCGLLLQLLSGLWTLPIFLDDRIINDSYPLEGAVNPSFRALAVHLLPLTITQLIDKGVKKIRTCVVFPKTYERDIICQGILCPTVYNIGQRKNDTPYAMSSWFFRPATDLTAIDSNNNVNDGAAIEFLHNKPLFTGGNRGAEIQNMYSSEVISNINDITDPVKYSTYFFVDENLLTFHSPDLEFDPQLSNIDWENSKLLIIALARLGAISGDIDIETKSTTMNEDAKGFVKYPVGYQTLSNKFVNGGLVSGIFYWDSLVSKNSSNEVTAGTTTGFMVYPWHRHGSLTNDYSRPLSEKARTSELGKKKISNLKFFSYNLKIDTFNFDISTPQLFNSKEVKLTKIHIDYLNKDVPYYGNVDTLISSGTKYPFYNSPLITGNPTSTYAESTTIQDSQEPVRMKFKSTPHLIFSLLKDINTISLLPRHSSIGGALSGNFSLPSWYNSSENNIIQDYTPIHGMYSTVQEHLLEVMVGKVILEWADIRTDSKELLCATAIKTTDGKIVKLRVNTDSLIIKLLPNTFIDTIDSYIFPNTTMAEYDKSKRLYIGNTRYYQLIKKGEVTLNPLNVHVFYYNLQETTVEELPADQKVYTLSLNTFGRQDERIPPYLLIGLIVREVSESIKFGGKGEDALLQNVWIPSSEPIVLNKAETVEAPYKYGDTWYSRYDCLKTYPFTQEDENSVVEIGSFMCETRVNIDGRYDKNRGLLSNLNMSPEIFNKLNTAYTQYDNFFPARILPKDYYKLSIFKNLITWSLEKQAGNEIDNWTHFTLATTLDMDGSAGKVTKLIKFNDILLCFQEKQISQIDFNSRVLIPTSDGTPIEISNSYKVTGSKSLTLGIGCTNKWSIAITSKGIYFIDDITKSLWMFNGLFVNLGETLNMTSWVKEIADLNTTWTPFYNTANNIRAFYDDIKQDIYFVQGPTINLKDALVYSEELQLFVSFMSYGGTLAMFNFNGEFYSLYLPVINGYLEDEVTMWLNNKGMYTTFYNKFKPYDVTFISNDNPTFNKIFDTLEFRADRFIEDSTIISEEVPFDYIRVLNEYQDTGIKYFRNTDFSTEKILHPIKKKFRIWRALIPRVKGSRLRIRNPWTKITLGSENTYNEKFQLHDIAVKYTI